MLGLVIALASTALGAGLSQELAWDVTISGQPVGSRTMEITYERSDRGMKRVISAITEIDASPAGIPFTYRQRLTAHIDDWPAAFHATIEDNGDPREIQGRLTPTGWVVTIIDGGRSRTWELAPNEIDLSSADFFDPETSVGLTKFDRVKVLSAETGDVWEAGVTRLGFSDVVVAGQKVAVEGVALDPPMGESKFFYTPDGILAQYSYYWLGREVQAVLREAPPRGIDDTPVTVQGGDVSATDL